MDRLKIISCHWIQNEYAMVLSKKLGIPIIKDLEPQDKDIYIVLGAQYAAADLVGLQKNHKIGYIIFNSDDTLRDKYYLQLLKSNPVFDCNQKATDILKKQHGINVLSHYFYEFMKVEDAPKPIDIGMIGSQEPDLVEKLKTKYPDKIIKFVLTDDIANPQQLKETMSSFKTFVNVDQERFDTYMVHQAFSCGCRVVSHDQADSNTLKFYDDYMTTTNKLEDHDYDSEEEMKPYDELVKQLTHMMTGHNHMIISNIIKC